MLLAFISGGKAASCFRTRATAKSLNRNHVKAEHFEDYLASGKEWRWWGVSSFVINREMFIRVGGFIEDRVNSEDADLALRLGVATGFVQITAPATFAYRVHAANLKDNLERTLAGIRYAVNAEKGINTQEGKPEPGNVERY